MAVPFFTRHSGRRRDVSFTTGFGWGLAGQEGAGIVIWDGDLSLLKTSTEFGGCLPGHFMESGAECTRSAKSDIKCDFGN
jgi:hypothetical protein